MRITRTLFSGYDSTDPVRLAADCSISINGYSKYNRNLTEFVIKFFQFYNYYVQTHSPTPNGVTGHHAASLANLTVFEQDLEPVRMAVCMPIQ